MQKSLDYSTYNRIIMIIAAMVIITICGYFYINREELFYKENNYIGTKYQNLYIQLPEAFKSPSAIETTKRSGKAYFGVNEQGYMTYEIPGTVLVCISEGSIDGVAIKGNLKEYKSTERSIKPCSANTDWGEQNGKIMNAFGYEILCVGTDSEMVDSILDSIKTE